MIRVDTKMQKELIIQKLKEQSCRITKQRQMILDVILSPSEQPQGFAQAWWDTGSY